MFTFAMLCGYILCIFLAILAGIILKMIWTGEIDLSGVLAEANGQASMSRLQLLIFTFVIAISLFMLVEKDGKTFPQIPDGVLTLLGISASTYAVGKGISYSREEGVTTHAERAAKAGLAPRVEAVQQVTRTVIEQQPQQPPVPPPPHG
jgi:hypothetical protein